MLCSMLFAGTAMAQLSGTYTINAGGTTSGTNYADFSDLATDLIADGVSGAVTVNVVASSGPYAENFYLEEISGASATNTITINGNGNTISQGGNIVELEGTDYITFNNLVFKETSSSSDKLFHAYGDCEYLTINNCEFIAEKSTAYAGYPAYYTSAYVWIGNNNFAYQNPTDENTNITITNNKMWKGSSSVNAYGKNYGVVCSQAQSMTSDASNVISGNDMQDLGQYGIYLRYASGYTINDNAIHNENNSNTNTYMYGIYIYNYFSSSNKACAINGNKIYELNGQRTYAYASIYGIYAYGYYASTDFEIRNNVIDLYGPYYKYGIYNYSYNASGEANIIGNTIVMDGVVTYAYTRHYGIYNYYAPKGEVKNNIITDVTQSWGSTSGGSWSIYTYNPNCTFDHNNLDNSTMAGGVLPSNAYIGYYSGNKKTLANWQSSAGAANSVSVDAKLANRSTYDWGPQSISMANKGGITTYGNLVDLDGVTRNTSSPDIGALEYTVDIEIESVDMVGTLSECAPYAEGVVVTIKNNSGFAMGDIPLQYTVNGGTAVKEKVAGPIAIGATASFTFNVIPTLNGTNTHVIEVSVQGDDDDPTNSSGSHTIGTTASPSGGDLTQGANFDGYFETGNMADPDATVKDYVLEYDISRPTKYSSAAPGVDYTYTVMATTMGGVDVTSLGFSLPSGDEVLTVDPDQSLADSTILMEVIVLDLNTNCDTTISRYLYVPHTPDVSFDASNICLGDVASFKNTSTLDGTDYMLNSWEFGDPDASVTDDNSEIKDGFWSYTAYGNADVTLTVINGEYPLFKYSVTKSITVTPKPELDFKVLNACEQSPIQFNNSSSLPVAGTIAYEWDFNGEGSSIDESPTFTFNTPGQRVVTLTGTANGCDATLSKNAYQFEMPTANFTTNGACNFVDVEFLNSSTIPNDANMGFAWDFGDGGISRLENASHAFATSGSKTVTLTATSEFGCVSVKNGTVSLNESPEADFAWDAACNLTPVSFTRTGSVPNGGANSSYAWDFNGESTSAMENPQYLFPKVGTKIVSLTVADLNGCSSSITKELDVVLQAVADFEVADVCEGDEAVFTNKSTVAAGDLQYEWDFNDNGATSSDLSPRHAYPVTGSTQIISVTLKAIVPGGCSDEISKQLTVNAAPDASFTVDKEGRTVSFDAAAGNSLYQWRFGDGASDDSEDPVYTYENVDVGTFEACLATKNAECWSESCQTITINLAGVEDLTLNNDMVNVYPNPTNGQFNLEVEKASDVTIVVADILGNIIPTQVIDNLNGKYNVNMSAIADGVYFVQVKNGNYYATKRITVTK